MKITQNDPTNQEILQTVNDILKAMNSFANEVVTKDDLKNELKRFATKEDLKNEISKVKIEMVTKDYLDKKVAEVRGDLVNLVRQEDKKVKKITSKLHSKKIFSKTDVKHITQMQPFTSA